MPARRRSGLLTLVLALATAGGPALATCGDPTGDGRIDILDALLAAQSSAGVRVLDPQQTADADADGSGTVDILDALLVALHASGLAPAPTCTPGGPIPPLPAPSWNDITAASPVAPVGRCEAAMARDPAGGRGLMFGGWGGQALGDLNDTWSLDDATGVWTRLFPLGTLPDGRRSHELVFDPAGNRAVLLFGFTGEPGPEIPWVLDFSVEARGEWRALAPAGPAPLARWNLAAAWDPVRQGVLIHGGTEYSGAMDLQDLQWLDLSGSPDGIWVPLNQTGDVPGARDGHTMVYDPAGDRFLMFGGKSWLQAETRDLWELRVGVVTDTGIWHRMTPAGPPPRERFFHEASFDPARQCMVLAGGHPIEHDVVDLLDLSGGGDGTWVAVAPLGTPPSRRNHPTLHVSPGGDGYLHGGVFTGPMLGDTWRLHLP